MKWDDMDPAGNTGEPLWFGALLLIAAVLIVDCLLAAMVAAVYWLISRH